MFKILQMLQASEHACRSPGNSRIFMFISKATNSSDGNFGSFSPILYEDIWIDSKVSQNEFITDYMINSHLE